jgi:hypothetical protein
VVDAGRIVTAGGIASGMEMGFHPLRRAGHGEELISEVARVMEHSAAYRLYPTIGGRSPDAMRRQRGCRLDPPPFLVARRCRSLRTLRDCAVNPVTISRW